MTCVCRGSIRQNLLVEIHQTLFRSGKVRGNGCSGFALRLHTSERKTPIIYSSRVKQPVFAVAVGTSFGAYDWNPPILQRFLLLLLNTQLTLTFTLTLSLSLSLSLAVLGRGWHNFNWHGGDQLPHYPSKTWNYCCTEDGLGLSDCLTQLKKQSKVKTCLEVSRLQSGYLSHGRHYCRA